MWLMQALGFLLSALPVEDILRNLHSLITPYIQQLEKLADETVRKQTHMYKQYTHTHTHTRTWSRHSWTLANKNRPCVCVVSLQWNISLRDQIGFDPAPWASDSHGSSTYTLSRSCERTHTTARDKLRIYKSADRGTITVGHAFTCACTTFFSPVLNVRFNRAWSFRLSCCTVQTWSSYYLKIPSLIFPGCGLKSIFFLIPCSTISKNLGWDEQRCQHRWRFSFLSQCLSVNLYHPPTFTQHTHIHTPSHPSSPTSSFTYCFMSSFVIYRHYIRLGNQGLRLEQDE